jgi:hypothetical protein
MRVFKITLPVIMGSLMAVFYSLSSNALDIPGQLSVKILQAPAPLKADGHYYLVYEDMLTNFQQKPVTLTSLKVNNIEFGQKELLSMVHSIAHRKSKEGEDSTDADKNLLTFHSGESKLVYVWLPFDQLDAVPDKLIQTVNYQWRNPPSDEAAGTLTVKTEPVNIDKTPLVIVNPPLKGAHWVFGNGPSNTSEHRKSHIIVNGNVHFAQRYAIDFVQIDDQDHLYNGDASENKSYYCYGKEVIAAAPGKVILVKDGMPDNIPGKKPAPAVSTAAGNYIIIQIDKNHYAAYAHFIPGSITVKEGDEVKKGQVIGKVGNSGNSSAPHLHFQISNSPSFLGSDAIPYGFNHFFIEAEYDKAQQKLINLPVPKKATDELALENTVVGF